MHAAAVTQNELAEKAGVSQGAISRYLNDKAAPRAEELHRLSVALGVSMERLLTGQGSVPSAPSENGNLRELKAETQKLLRQLEAVEETAARLRRFFG